MAINKLTDAAVRNARAKAAPYKLTDGEGLHLLVSTAGGRLWKLAYRYQGKQKTLALGAYPAVTLAEARAGRDGAKKLLQDGRDPSFAKRLDAERQAHEDASIFRVVAKSWFAAREGRWSAAHASRIWARIEHDLVGPLGDMRVGEIEGADVLKALRKIKGRGATETAHRVKA